MKMGKLLAEECWTSLDMMLSPTNEFVHLIEEVRGNGTSDWVEIARSDSGFFGETFFRDGQDWGSICGGDDLWHSG